MAQGTNFCPACGHPLGSPAIQRFIDDARRDLNANPDDTSARYNLALAYKLAGLDDLALKEFGVVAQLQPDFVDVHYEIGLLQAKAGQAEEARAALERVLELEPGHGRARRMLEGLRGPG